MKYAVANTASLADGTYSEYNFNPVKYYVVAKQALGPGSLAIFDSIAVPILGIARDTMILQ